MHSEPSGYCYFNNAAIAAKHAVENFWLGTCVARGFWDLHHGTSRSLVGQFLLYDDPRLELLSACLGIALLCIICETDRLVILLTVG